MDRLTADRVRGIWAGVTLSWDETFAFEEETYARNIERMIAADMHGIYTTGSTGEFYVLDFDEFTVKEVGAAQVTIPYWMELTDRELLQFFKDLHTACPDIPLVHYNVPRAKRFLHGDDYLRILEVAPNLIGVKYTFAGSNFAALQTDMMKTSQLSYFVGENMLVSAMMLGARGSYSSLVATDPAYTLDMYDKACAGRWDEAIRMQQNASRFFDEAAAFVDERGEGDIDPVFDKGLAVAAGCVLGHQRGRPPHIGWSDRTIEELRQWLKDNYPEFVYKG